MVDGSHAATVTIDEVNMVKEGDLLVKFSDGTVVLFHAKFLYDVRNHDGNVEIVDPFRQ
jgi:ethanolamine utilization protein EutQ (cupin superfamily)